MTLPVIFPTVMVAGGTPSISFEDSAFDDVTGSTSSPATFTGVSFGSASGSRRVLVGAAISTNGTPSVTIGGVSATQVALATNGAVKAGLYLVDLPTGTSGTVVVSSTAVRGDAFIAVWAVYNIRSSTPTATATDTGATPWDVSLNVEHRGVAASFLFGNGTGVASASWTGMTEDVDTLGDGTSVYTGASYTAVAAQSPLSVTASVTSATAGAICSASFR